MSPIRIATVVPISRALDWVLFSRRKGKRVKEIRRWLHYADDGLADLHRIMTAKLAAPGPDRLAEGPCTCRASCCCPPASKNQETISSYQDPAYGLIEALLAIVPQ